MSRNRMVLIIGLLIVVALGWMVFAPGSEEPATPPAGQEQPAPRGLLATSVEGDFVLFAFTAAGISIGFILGYFWRDQLVKKQSEASSRDGEP